MIPIAFRRRLWLVALPAIAAVVLTALAMAPPSTSGQTGPAVTAAAAPVVGSVRNSPAPALDNDLAVRMLLPASIRDSVRLPVRKWARADMPDASGGYVIFIATIYPIYDGLGGSTEWLLTNYLQWDGGQWLPALANYPGEQLTRPDDLFLARNLNDISAFRSPPAQLWQIFTVEYTAEGQVSSSLARSETLTEVYDLSDTTVWSRVTSLSETDTGNQGYVIKHAEVIDWALQDIDNDGLYELVATVTVSDQIVLTGDPAPAGTTLPPAGTTTTKTTEIYKWVDGVYVLQRQAPSAPTAPIVTGTPAASPTVAATAPAAGATQSPPRTQATAPPVPVSNAAPTPSPTPSPAPSGTPSG